MTSKIGVKKIQYPNGTDILTLDSSGSLAIGNSATVGGTLGVTGTQTNNGNFVVSKAIPNVDIKDTGTAQASMDFLSNSDTVRATIGIERSAGGGLFVGSSAYSAVFGTASSGNTEFATNNNIRMTIDSVGRVTIPNQLTCLLYKNGNQSVSQNTGFQVTGWAAVNDPASMYDNSNARITVPIAGQYIIGGHIQANQVGGVHFSILKNGSAIGNDSYLNMGDALGSGYSICINCSANDYFTMGGYVTTAATVVSANRSKWWIQKVA